MSNCSPSHPLLQQQNQLTLNGQLLNGSALPTAVVGGEGVSLDAATGTHTAGQNVVGVQVVTSLNDKLVIK